MYRRPRKISSKFVNRFLVILLTEKQTDKHTDSEADRQRDNGNLSTARILAAETNNTNRGVNHEAGVLTAIVTIAE